jgi:hypothetical protein
VGWCVVAILAIAVAACSGDDGPDSNNEPPSGGSATVSVTTPSMTPAPDSPPPTPSAPTPVPSSTPSPTAGIDALSLVYVDTSGGQGGDVYVADADGANPSLVTSETSFSRPLDLRGRMLAAAGTGGLLFIDLESGEPVYINGSAGIFDGRFLDEGVFLYSLSASCGQSGAGLLRRVEFAGSARMPAVEVVPLVIGDHSFTIAGLDPATNSVTLAPRGCDPGVSSLDTYDALTGQLRNSLAVAGCGWVGIVPQHNKAIVSWLFCTPPAAHADADATVYDFGIAGPTGQDIVAPDEGSNFSPWLLRPDAPEAALGTTVTLGDGPRGERSGGLYLVDLTTRVFRQLVEGEGAEQHAVAWSPDGRYLLYANVEVQGMCSFAYIDVEDPSALPVAVSPHVTFCGANGYVVGWTRLP